MMQIGSECVYFLEVRCSTIGSGPPDGHRASGVPQKMRHQIQSSVDAGGSLLQATSQVQP